MYAYDIDTQDTWLVSVSAQLLSTTKTVQTMPVKKEATQRPIGLIRRHINTKAELLVMIRAVAVLLNGVRYCSSVSQHIYLKCIPVSF